MKVYRSTTYRDMFYTTYDNKVYVSTIAHKHWTEAALQTDLESSDAVEQVSIIEIYNILYKEDYEF